VVVLREVDSDRYLPIWVGPFEADAITIGLQGIEVGRPLTHDLLHALIDQLGGSVSHILVSDLQEDTFFARIVMDVDGRHGELDARPSDAIALAVRAQVPIYVADEVMERAAVLPSDEEEEVEAETTGQDDDKLEVFRQFVEGLDLDDLGDGDAESGSREDETEDEDG
jgi:hypothetical protein